MDIGSGIELDNQNQAHLPKSYVNKPKLKLKYPKNVHIIHTKSRYFQFFKDFFAFKQFSQNTQNIQKFLVLIYILP